MATPTSEAKEIFGQAIDYETGPARSEFLNQICGANSEVRAEVEGLIQALEQAGDFMSRPAAASMIDALGPEAIHDGPGTVIGRYKLLEQIGEGGMGVVYLAEQQVPVRRRVALKIIKPGMDTRQVIARFEAERQALAMMDHPNIARALDAGVTDSGRPYFVMELVRGIPITDYCDQDNLSIPARLELFVYVCHAVQHAHQNGIIHRDIKPSNVLVTMHDGRGVPKVIDFGVAKATNGQLTDKTLFTNFSQIIGTPSYMSPEQAEMSGLDVDTRSDIYSLGVLLYELLTGSTPFDKTRLREAAYDEMRRIIREEEPLTPSAFVNTLGPATTTLAFHRKVDPGGFARLLRGDLDWIVMKALEKERGRRYPTANDLARDIENYLHHKPVDARPPSPGYRLQKFARRNRVVFITTAVVAAALVAGTIVSTWQAIRARQAENIAESERNEADLQRKRAEDNFQKARKAVDNYVLSIRDSKLFSEPTYQPLRKELVESTLAYYRQFIEQYRNDRSLQPELALAYVRIGEITNAIGSQDQACDAIQKGAAVYQRLCSTHPGNPDYQFGLGDALNDLATVQRNIGQTTESAQSSGRALKIFEALHRGNAGEAKITAELAKAIFHRFIEQNSQGTISDAEVSLRRALALYQTLTLDCPNIGTHRANLANAYFNLGRLQQSTACPDEAIRSFQQSAQIYEQTIADFGEVANLLLGVAHAYFDQATVSHSLGRDADASSAFQRSGSAYQKLDDQSPTTPTGRMGLGRVNYRLGVLLSEAGEKAAAESSWATAAADFDAAARLGYPPIKSFNGLAEALALQGKWKDAAAAYAHVVEASDHALRPMFQLALLQVAAEDGNGYRQSCANLLERHGDRATDSAAAEIVTACVVGDAAGVDMQRVLAIAQRVAASDSGAPVKQWLLGAAEFRSGQITEAIEILEPTLPLFETAENATPKDRDQIRSYRLLAATILASAYRQANDEKALAAHLESLRALVANFAAALPQYDEENPRWFLGLALHLATRELCQHDDPRGSPGTSEAH